MKQEEVEELIIAHLTGNIDDKSEKKLMSWLEENEQNKKTYTAFEKLWKSSEKVTEIDNLDVDKALENVWHDIEKKRVNKPKFSIYLKFAAAAVIIFFIAIIALDFNNDSVQNQVAQEANIIKLQYHNQSDSARLIKLPDNSKVYISANTQLEYEYGNGVKNRKCHLVGNAFFEVKRDTSLPFVIETSTGTVTVLGTSFEINQFSDSSIVKVYTGKVQVRSFNQEATPAILTKGMAASTSLSSNEIVVSNINISSQPSWVKKKYAFRNTPLNEVVAELMIGFGKKIIIESPEVSQCNITARYSSKKLDKILTSICNTLQLTWELEGDTYIIKGQKCE